MCNSNNYTEIVFQIQFPCLIPKVVLQSFVFKTKENVDRELRE